MAQCEAAWSKKIMCELLKCGIKKQGDSLYIKYTGRPQNPLLT
jgi:hypothetical protein